jgi:predicted RNA-binding protein
MSGSVTFARLGNYMDGNEKLLPKSEWLPLSEINTDFRILQRSMFSKVFNNMLERHKPKHNTAFLSVCTKTRPYSESRKWKKFIELFAESSDLIVISNAGIFPREFWNSYPTLTYDGDNNLKATDLYQRVLKDRLTQFL